MGSYCCADKGYEYLLIDSCSKEVVSQPSKDDVSRVAVERSEYLKLLEIYPKVCENPESLSLFKDAEFPPSSESFGDMFPEQTVAW